MKKVFITLITAAFILFGCGGHKSPAAVDKPLPAEISDYSGACAATGTIENSEGLSGEEKLTIVQEGPNINIAHENIIIECCYESFGLSMVKEGNVINIYEELEFPDDMSCNCICAFRISSVIVNLTPGQYTVRVYLGTGLRGEKEIEVY